MQKILYSNENNTKYLQILNLTPPLAEQEIKSAYRQFVKSNHPDLFKLEENKKLAAAKFKIATVAYEYLLKHWKDINNFEDSIKKFKESKINTDAVDKLIASIRTCDEKIYEKFHARFWQVNNIYLIYKSIMKGVYYG